MAAVVEVLRRESVEGRSVVKVKAMANLEGTWEVAEVVAVAAGLVTVAWAAEARGAAETMARAVDAMATEGVSVHPLEGLAVAKPEAEGMLGTAGAKWAGAARATSRAMMRNM